MAGGGRLPPRAGAAALPTGEVEVHDGAVHGFAVPGPAYHGAAAERSDGRAEAVFALR